MNRELEGFDLQLGAAEPVPANEIHIKVDGVDDVRVENLRRRVADVLGAGRDGHSLVTPKTPPLSRPPRASGDALEIRVVGNAISPTRQKELEEAIGWVIDDELGDEPVDRTGPDIGPAGAAPRSHFACVHAGLGGDRIGDGTLANPPWFTSSGAWQPPPSGGDVWIIAVQLDSPGWNFARLTLRPGAAADPPFGKDQILLGLTNSTDWAKQIWGTNLCEGRTKSVFQTGKNGLAHTMPLVHLSGRQGIDTIEFTKPGFFGVWHDVGHMPPETFWPAFGGTWAIFDWVID